MLHDHLTELRAALRRYVEAEQELIATRPTLHETDEENYSDSCKWLRFPLVDETPETVSSMILSTIEDSPNDCLAGVLAAVLKNQVPNGIRLSSMCIDRIGNSFQFCIAGSTSSEELRNLREQYSGLPDQGGEK